MKTKMNPEMIKAVSTYIQLHAELVQRPNLTWDEYVIKSGNLQHAIITDLKFKGLLGRERNKVNNIMERHRFHRTRQFLYARDPHCGICGGKIHSLEEVTIDHIVPSFAGGTNEASNKQIAHIYCNSVTKNREDLLKYKPAGAMA